MAEVVRAPAGTDEKHFDTTSTGYDDGTGDAKVSDTLSYTSVNTVNKYVFMGHTHGGTGGYRDGTYLIPHDREMFYRKRRDFSVYKNFLKPVVSALVDPVYGDDIQRVILSADGGEEGSPIARAYLDNVDGAGTDMQSYAREVMTMARLHGVCFVLIDNYPSDMQPATVAEAVDERIYPYAVLKTPDQVAWYKTDDWGRLEELAFYGPVKVNGTGKKTCTARMWTTEYSQGYEEQDDAKGKKWVAVGPQVVHGLGVMPIVSVYTATRTSCHDILPDPPLYDVAKLNLLIYNKDSEIRDLERSQAFSVLYLQSDMSGNITISNHNAIIVPQGSTMAPGYISPDAGILTQLVANNKGYMDDLFRSAEQYGVHAVQSSQSPSGVALAWRFWAVEFALKNTSRVGAATEAAIMDILSLYTGESYEYVADYPATFQPGDTTSTVQNLKTISDMNPPDVLKSVIYKKIAKLIMSDASDDELKKVLAELEYEEVEKQAPAPTEKPEETPETVEIPESMPTEEMEGGQSEATA